MRNRLAQVARPLLPRVDKLRPYLELIDETRWYANHGALVATFGDRLAEKLTIESDQIAIANSGTAALEAAVLAAAGRAKRDRPLAIMPSYTFAATALAAIRCGYEPFFVDIDPETWALDVDMVAGIPELKRAGVIISVAPYGRMPDVKCLEDLRTMSGIPVVLDAAAAIEEILSSPSVISQTVPIAVSFHATKPLSTGEGGAVFWLDRDGILKISSILNFGFNGSRECLHEGFNGKMSEYHAAIGLATLDSWSARSQSVITQTILYRKLMVSQRFSGLISMSPCVASAYTLYIGRSHRETQTLLEGLTSAGIASRYWYDRGLHAQPAFRCCGSTPLDVTEDAAARILGIPSAVDLDHDDIAHLLQVITSVTKVPNRDYSRNLVGDGAMAIAATY